MSVQVHHPNSRPPDTCFNIRCRQGRPFPPSCGVAFPWPRGLTSGQHTHAFTVL